MSERTVVAQWSISPLPSYEGTATFYSDGSAEFFDEPTRHLEYDRANQTRMVLFSVFAEHDPHLSDEVCRYTFTFRIPTALLNKIVATCNKIIVSEDGDCISDITRDEEAQIDAALNEIFWRDINPKLWRPLDEPPASRTSHQPFNTNMTMRDWIEASIEPKKPWLPPPWCWTATELDDARLQFIASTHPGSGMSSSEPVLLYMDSQVPGDRAAGIVLTDKAVYWRSPLGESGSCRLDRLGLVTLRPGDTTFHLHIGAVGHVRLPVPEPILRTCVELFNEISFREHISEVGSMLQPGEQFELHVFGSGGSSSGIITCTTSRIIQCRDEYFLHVTPSQQREVHSFSYADIVEITVDYGRPHLSRFGHIVVRTVSDSARLESEFFLLEEGAIRLKQAWARHTTDRGA